MRSKSGSFENPKNLIAFRDQYAIKMWSTCDPNAKNQNIRWEKFYSDYVIMKCQFSPYGNMG